MHILIRVDASLDIGGGHFIRCFMLAQALSKKGYIITFASIFLPNYFRKMLQNEGFNYLNLEKSEVNLLCLDEVLDAKNLISLSGHQVWNWVIVDHYSLSSIWEFEIRPVAKKIFSIDDLANRNHNCNLLLDQNYEDDSRYTPIVNKDCELLLGPKYALINPELLNYKNFLKNGEVKKVLIYFGASDRGNLTGKTFDILSGDEFKHLYLDVVYGIHYQFLGNLKNMASTRGRATLYGPQPHLGKLMQRADLAIGAGGVSNWERLCVGLPSIVIAIAQNQVKISKNLGEIGLISYLGSIDDVSELDISSALRNLCAKNHLAKVQAAGQELCDGLGVSRVVERMIALNNLIGS
jgi:UDP-2,4-diacetamido-2,4,6-trideoxy-beta-L-altropyranose hydrolase